jgi:hypothetical protein
VPFLRVIRDKRGYETTYLMHWYREGNRQRSRILYVFRSPGGVRVGRNPLEPEVLRQIERQHPDIQVDWKAVVDNQQVVEPPSDQRRPRRREAPSAPAAKAAEPAPAASAVPPQQQQPPRPAVPSAIEGTTAEEQIAFLTIWYPRLRERVPKRTGDPARQEALLGLAERLNPANWIDADQIAAGLQQAGEALERLSHVFARRRRRSRRPQAAVEQSVAASNVDGGLDKGPPTDVEASVDPSHFAPSHPEPSSDPSDQ